MEKSTERRKSIEEEAKEANDTRLQIDGYLANMCEAERRIYEGVVERRRITETLGTVLTKIEGIERLLSRVALVSVLNRVRSGLDDVKARVSEVRNAQQRKREANLRHRAKVADGRLDLGMLKVHDLGVLPPIVKYPGFEALHKQWVKAFHAALERHANPYKWLETVGCEWNHAFERLAVTRSNGYMHYLVSERARLKTTDFEFTGFTRKHGVPKTAEEVDDWRNRKIFDFGRLVVAPVLRETEFVRDGKHRRFWETLALLCDGGFEVKVAGSCWDPNEPDHKKLLRMLKRVWPDLQRLAAAFLRGLRHRTKVDATTVC